MNTTKPLLYHLCSEQTIHGERLWELVGFHDLEHIPYKNTTLFCNTFESLSNFY